MAGRASGERRRRRVAEVGKCMLGMETGPKLSNEFERYVGSMESPGFEYDLEK